MKGTLGRTRRVSCLVITGNKNGLAGFALAKSVETKAAIRKAKNRAGQKLVHVKRYKDHTGKLINSFKIHSSSCSLHFIAQLFNCIISP